MFQNSGKKPNAEKDPLPGEILQGEVSEEIQDSSARRRWLCATWMLTWWVPNFVLSSVGGMKRLDIRQAWREKLAINMLIWIVCGISIFVIAILGLIICPHEYVFSEAEVKSHSYNADPGHTYTYIRGEVFQLTSFLSTHLTQVNVVPTKTVMKYGGLDASPLFPVQVSYASLECETVSESI